MVRVGTCCLFCLWAGGRRSCTRMELDSPHPPPPDDAAVTAWARRSRARSVPRFPNRGALRRAHACAAGRGGWMGVPCQLRCACHLHHVRGCGHSHPQSSATYLGPRPRSDWADGCMRAACHTLTACVLHLYCTCTAPVLHLYCRWWWWTCPSASSSSACARGRCP